MHEIRKQWNNLKNFETGTDSFEENFFSWEGGEGGEDKTGIFRRTPMQNRSNKPCMEVENN